MYSHTVYLLSWIVLDCLDVHRLYTDHRKISGDLEGCGATDLMMGYHPGWGVTQTAYRSKSPARGMVPLQDDLFGWAMTNLVRAGVFSLPE